MRYGIVATAMLLTVSTSHAETCIASVYGGERHGTNYCNKITASGELHDCAAMTAARPSRKYLGTHAMVCHGPVCKTVRIYDVGPFVKGRCIDLSPAAANALKIDGLGLVTVETIQ